MLDYGWVNTRLAVGGHLNNDPSRLEELVNAGITHIINLQVEEDDAPLIQKCGANVQYLRVPMWDDHESKPNEFFHAVIDFSLGALVVPRTKVYIHCAAGISRSTSMVYAVLRALGWDSATASRLVIIARPIAQLNYKQDADRAVHELGYNNGY